MVSRARSVPILGAAGSSRSPRADPLRADPIAARPGQHQVAVRRRAARFKGDRPKTLVQLEPIGMAPIRAANAVGVGELSAIGES